jgi:glycosyltransferase involved in cell wall biosynthesis
MTSSNGVRNFRVLVMASAFEPGFRAGGPIRSLAGVVDTVSETIDVYLITRDRDLGAVSPYPGLSGQWVQRGQAKVFYLNIKRFAQWLTLWRDLRRIRFGLLYLNSFWDPLFTLAPVLALRAGLIRSDRVLIAPRGELARSALSVKPWKKRLFLRVFLAILKSTKPVWHAASEREMQQIRSAVPDAEIQFAQNPVAAPLEPLPPTRGAKQLRIVYIGRIAPVKNLHSALAALNAVSHGVEFDIFGPVENVAYWSKCNSIIEGLPDHVRVAYRGELSPPQVRPMFSRFDAFVFPTLGENFGHIVVDSLSASCPVISARTTPWTDVLESGGGLVVAEPNSAEFAAAIDRFAALSPRQRLEARKRAGEAYRAWRRTAPTSNVLELLRAK